ncbi:hypothetical protein M9H77_26907 [Catharanthus roseus]|uniref:Uncharacterized protein n=1 Tax=Catharanthus roseus TaxID=4058 RepID=A0ACC0ABW1_CATRO|nr:hypothetical protein M9H77_26907 [Catharanthus roseus]
MEVASGVNAYGKSNHGHINFISRGYGILLMIMAVMINSCANVMTRDKHENIEIFQGLVTRSMVVYENALEGENVDRRGTKILLMAMMNKREPKEASVEDKKAQIAIGIKKTPYCRQILVYTFLVHYFVELEYLETPQKILRR